MPAAKKNVPASKKASGRAETKSAPKFRMPELAVGDRVVLSYSEELTRKSGKEDWEEYYYGEYPAVFRGIRKKNGKDWMLFRVSDEETGEEWDTYVDPATGVCLSGVVLDRIGKVEEEEESAPPPKKGPKSAPAPKKKAKPEPEPEEEEEEEEEEDGDEDELAYTL